jgi:outer membrane protein OmpA-like peptidoglycan-associated protein
MHRSLLVASLFVVSTALAQSGDEWSTFPPPPPPTTTPAPAPAPTPAPTPAPVAPKPAPAPAVTKAPAATVDAGVPAPPKAPTAARPETRAASDAGVDDEAGLRVVSKKERYLAGTEPHSPSTWGNPWDATENARVTTSQVGIGNLFAPSARLGPAGVVRVSVLGEYLNQADFPVRSAQDIRSAITFAASFQPFEWGEIFVSYGAAANSNNRTSPNLIQSLGDLSLGVKASREWVKGLWAGADLRLLTFSGVGNQGVDRFAVGFRPTLLGTYDFRSLSRSVPVLFTLGLGFTLDTTAGLVQNQKLNASEEFALGVHAYNRFNFSAALEVPLPVVSPVIEYSLAAPLGVPNGELTGPDGKFVNVAAAMPQTLGLGLKITAVKDLTLTTGVNLGLTRSVGLGVPATAPWNFFLGAGFAIDPFQRGETKFVDTIRERQLEVAKAVVPARLEGAVTDAKTGQPLPGVIVAVAGVKPSATDAAGRYESLALTGTSAKVSVAREGYKAVEREVTIADGQATKLDLALEPDEQKAHFEVSTTTAKTKPVKATITFKGPVEAKGETPGGAAPAEFDLPPGHYVINATAEGFLAQTRDVVVQSGGKLVVTFDLVPTPKKLLVVFKGDKIEILQQVRFDTGKATIQPASFNLLQQVVDAIITNDVKRVRVEGHTDNKGVKAANQTLSEDRARAVMEYLVAQGVDKARLESVGYGDSKPIAPNLTARGRELNRRVEFIVLEK